MRALLAPIALLAACAGSGPSPEPPPGEKPRTAWELHVQAAEVLYTAMLRQKANSLQDLLEAESRLSQEERDEILALVVRGEARAREQIEARPQDAEGPLVLGFHLAMQGIAKGKTRSFFEGIPGQVIEQYRIAVKLDDRIHAAGPLQLRGRFRTVVPFPYRDLNIAHSSLAAAVAIEPVKLSLFFLGDACAWQGRTEEAERIWRRAIDAKPANGYESLAPLIDQLTQRRLDMLSE